MPTKVTLAAAALLLIACAQPGQEAIGTPEWLAALQRARDHGKLDDSCIDDGITYELLDRDEWKSRGLDPTLGGLTTESGEVVVRKEGVKGLRGYRHEYTSSFIMEHEFLHAILNCSGSGDFENQLHIGHVWDGLRNGDPEK